MKFFYRLQKRHEDENKRYKEHMKNKMEMLLKLKGDITANRVFDHIHCTSILTLKEKQFLYKGHCKG